MLGMHIVTIHIRAHCILAHVQVHDRHILLHRVVVHNEQMVVEPLDVV